MLVDAKFEHLKSVAYDFWACPDDKNSYALSKALHDWREQQKQYNSFKNVYQAGWGQEDTKHE